LFDSLGFAAESLSQASDVRTRRVVILLSDGEDTISRLTAREAITDLLENDVQVYALDVNATASSHGSWFLQELSAATGGRFFPLSAGARAVADAVLADFHASYRVSYRLPYLAAGFHTIRILPTHNLNLSFRSRQGYYYPAGR
jgi:VWFA-related protein